MDTLASRLGLDESTVKQIQHSLEPEWCIIRRKLK